MSPTSAETQVTPPSFEIAISMLACELWYPSIPVNFSELKDTLVT